MWASSLALLRLRLSAAAVGFKKSNNFGALLSGGEAAIRLHFVTGHHLVGVSDEAIERGPIHVKSASFMALE